MSMPQIPHPEDQMRGLVVGLFIGLAIVLAFHGCAHIPPPRPIDGHATCADMCDRARVMGCAFAADTPEGDTCETVCGNIQTSGVVALDLDCRAKAASCDAAETCEAAK